MRERIKFRLEDITGAIGEIRNLLDGKTFAAMHTDRVTRAAFERFLERDRIRWTHRRHART